MWNEREREEKMGERDVLCRYGREMGCKSGRREGGKQGERTECWQLLSACSLLF